MTALVESKTRNFEINEKKKRKLFARLNTQFKENLAINQKTFWKKTPLKLAGRVLMCGPFI